MSSELPPPEPGDRAPRHERLAPNYAIRRAIVAGAAVLVTAVAVAAAAIVIRDERDDGGATTTTWNAVALINRANGAIRVLDDEGEEIATIRGTGRVESVHASGDRLALVGATQIALAGIDGADPIVVPIEQGSTVSRVATSRSFTLVVAPASGGNLVLIDASDGSQLDVGALAEQPNPMLLADSIRPDTDGTAFAIGDGRNFQTVVVRFGRGDAAFFPDVPMAVADELVVTSQTVGTSAELGFFDADGERQATVASEERPVGGLIDGDRFVFVSDTGAIYAAAAGDESPRRLGVIALAEGEAVQSVWPALDDTRLVASGSGFQAIVDLEGTTLFEAAFTAATTTLTPSSRWRCLPVGGSGVFTSLVDLATGDTLADLESGDVAAVGSDGCGVELTRDGGRSVVTRGGSTVVPAAIATVWIAPDSSAAVLVDTGSAASLVGLATGDGDGDDDGAEPVELGDVDGLVAFLDH
jgi:hypothetical protein